MAERRAVEIGFGQVLPARGLYGAAVEHGRRRVTRSRASAELADWARTWLGGDLGAVVATTAAAGDRIVQEHVGVEVLADLALVDWFG